MSSERSGYSPTTPLFATGRTSLALLEPIIESETGSESESDFEPGSESESESESGSESDAKTKDKFEGIKDITQAKSESAKDVKTKPAYITIKGIPRAVTFFLAWAILVYVCDHIKDLSIKYIATHADPYPQPSVIILMLQPRRTE